MSFKKAFYFVQQRRIILFSAQICAISNREDILFAIFFLPVERDVAAVGQQQQVGSASHDKKGGGPRSQHG